MGWPPLDQLGKEEGRPLRPFQHVGERTVLKARRPAGEHLLKLAREVR